MTTETAESIIWAVRGGIVVGKRERGTGDLSNAKRENTESSYSTLSGDSNGKGGFHKNRKTGKHLRATGWGEGMILLRGRGSGSHFAPSTKIQNRRTSEELRKKEEGGRRPKKEMGRG